MSCLEYKFKKLDTSIEEIGYKKKYVVINIKNIAGVTKEAAVSTEEIAFTVQTEVWVSSNLSNTSTKIKLSVVKLNNIIDKFRL